MLFLSADYTDGAIRIRVICEISVSVMALLFGVRIINRVMQSTAFLAFHSLTHDEITHIDHVTQFADLFGGYATLEQAFRLFIKDVQTIPCAFEPEVAADDTHVGTHYLVYLFHALGNQYHLFR